MSKYTGKDLEQDVLEAFKESPNGTSILRLYDPTGGKQGVANPCDFIVASSTGTHYVECKVTHENTLPFSNIGRRQWEMLEISQDSNYTKCGFIIYYANVERLVYIDIAHVAYIKNVLGDKSVNINKHKEFLAFIEFDRPRKYLKINALSILGHWEYMYES